MTAFGQGRYAVWDASSSQSVPKRLVWASVGPPDVKAISSHHRRRRRRRTKTNQASKKASINLSVVGIRAEQTGSISRREKKKPATGCDNVAQAENMCRGNLDDPCSKHELASFKSEQHQNCLEFSSEARPISEPATRRTFRDSSKQIRKMIEK